jgi:hypothetical protein
MLKVLPETIGRYEALQADIGPEVLPHMIVGLVLRPFLTDLLKPGSDDGVRRRAFRFLEDMACSSDPEVVNLVGVEVFEAWVSEPETLKRAWKHLLVGSRREAEDTAHGLGCGKNLPRVL